MADADEFVKHLLQGVLHDEEVHQQLLKSSKGNTPCPEMRRTRSQMEKDIVQTALESHLRTMGLQDSKNNLTHLEKSLSITLLDRAYPPSIEPLSKLAPIRLRDLKLETHHRGRVLVGRTFPGAFRASRGLIAIGIEDACGDVDYLMMSDLTPTVAIKTTLPTGVFVAVKEPYYKLPAQGLGHGVCVHVDHPTDLVFLDLGHELIPKNMLTTIQSIALGTEKTAAELKGLGNAAFQRKDWTTAVKHYTAALHKLDGNTSDPQLKCTLHRNRAGARLHLGHYELAHQDGLLAIIPNSASDLDKSLNMKAHFRAGRAAYALGNFAEAERLFEQAVLLDPNPRAADRLFEDEFDPLDPGPHNEAVPELKRSRARRWDQRLGEYDFALMRESVVANRGLLDHASFVKNTRIASAGHRGRGLFATKDLKPGELVLVEKAYCAEFVQDADSRAYPRFLLSMDEQATVKGTTADLFFAILKKLTANPKQATQFLQLHDGGSFTKKRTAFVDGRVALDIFQVATIVLLNSFGCPGFASLGSTTDKDASAGFWLRASLLNHSCVANVYRAFIGDMMILRASANIKKGEEIFTEYRPGTTPFEERKECFSQYGFQCDCRLCEVEAKTSAELVQERKRLEHEANEWMEAGTKADWWARGVPAAMIEAKRLQRDIAATYGSDFDNLPRVGCMPIDVCILCVHLASASKDQDAVEAGLRLLRDLGYFITVKDHDIEVNRDMGLVSREAVSAALMTGAAYEDVGNLQAMMSFMILAQQTYIIYTGSRDGFETCGFGPGCGPQEQGDLSG